jgi:hypothetical protein
LFKCIRRLLVKLNVRGAGLEDHSIQAVFSAGGFGPARPAKLGDKEVLWTALLSLLTLVKSAEGSSTELQVASSSAVCIEAGWAPLASRHLDKGSLLLGFLAGICSVLVLFWLWARVQEAWFVIWPAPASAPTTEVAVQASLTLIRRVVTVPEEVAITQYGACFHTLDCKHVCDRRHDVKRKYLDCELTSPHPDGGIISGSSGAVSSASA